MAFYENTLVVKQDLAEKDLKDLRSKYNDLINKSSGKVIKLKTGDFLIWLKKLKITTKDFLFIINLKEMDKL